MDHTNIPVFRVIKVVQNVLRSEVLMGLKFGYYMAFQVPLISPWEFSLLFGIHNTNYRINDLERGVEYEFRVAGQNHIGTGQEAIKYMRTPEGPPTGPPTNISYHFQTSDIVCISWNPPAREHRKWSNKNTEYVFYITAYTSQGSGPNSEKTTIKTEKDIVKATMTVKALATSNSSVEVWWKLCLPQRQGDRLYNFYTMTAVDCQKKLLLKLNPKMCRLNLRAHKVTTHSMTLSWSPPIQLNPVKYKIAFDAIKEFVDSQGITQTQNIPKVEVILNADVRSHTINELSPFTTYHVNVSAIPTDNSYTSTCQNHCHYPNGTTSGNG
ncbi:hypothetical protein NQ317_008054 [Molorchus minor]|uniref:Fibronectin type-III domain-containing protein n=1 Tax=Molorchus minor TaxID=1323400 RepID=A0ABQ9ITW0_9CUCU|nr:hypothetical protein NQ317_008054 [Molorchus minor]